MDVIRYHTKDGHIACLRVKRGRSLTHLIPMSSRGIKIIKVQNSEEKHFAEINTSVKKAKVIFRRAAKNFGVTKSARQYLRG